MTTNRMELLSAFIDGEEVDPQELARALAAPGARELLRDFALLRAELREDDEQPSASFYARMERRLEHRPSARPWWQRMIPIPAPALAAAALITVALAGWALRDRPVIESERPPEPDRVIAFVPGVDWQEQQP